MITVRTLISCNKKVKDLIIFLRHNKAVKEVTQINDDNESFCTLFNLLIESRHENESAYVSYRKGVKETFKPNKYVDMQVLA